LSPAKLTPRCAILAHRDEAAGVEGSQGTDDCFAADPMRRAEALSERSTSEYGGTFGRAPLGCLVGRVPNGRTDWHVRRLVGLAGARSVGLRSSSRDAARLQTAKREGVGRYGEPDRDRQSACCGDLSEPWIACQRSQRSGVLNARPSSERRFRPIPASSSTCARAAAQRFDRGKETVASSVRMARTRARPRVHDGRESWIGHPRGYPQVVRSATSGHGHQITGWVSRTARLRAPATQPMKGVARERRGTPCADLEVSSGAS
jgi:hypothetical protein